MVPRVLVAVGVVVLLTALTGCVAESSAVPSAPTPLRTVEAASPTPTASPSPALVEATCENTSTTEFQMMMTENDWVSWSGSDATGWPFGEFPGGAPAGHIACTWGADPNLATDNVITLAWAPIDAAGGADAQTYLEAAGFERINTTEGVYMAQRSETGWADAEGYGASYLFTAQDVRWAMFKEELKYVKAPDEAS